MRWWCARLAQRGFLALYGRRAWSRCGTRQRIRSAVGPTSRRRPGASRRARRVRTSPHRSASVRCHEAPAVTLSSCCLFFHRLSSATPQDGATSSASPLMSLGEVQADPQGMCRPDGPSCNQPRGLTSPPLPPLSGWLDEAGPASQLSTSSRGSGIGVEESAAIKRARTGLERLGCR
jgi:hypothetical protein